MLKAMVKANVKLTIIRPIRKSEFFLILRTGILGGRPSDSVLKFISKRIF